jgi:hypothetical protein
MKLSAQDTQFLQSILATCAALDIDSIIIDEGKVRGINAPKSAALISAFNIPSFPQKIGLSHLGSLKSRLDLFAGNAATVIDAKETDRGEINSLDISAGRSKVQFRCTSAILIKAPKVINDEPAFSLFITKSENKMLLDAIRVMGAKRIVLTVRKDRAVAFELSDASNNAFKIDLETPCERLGEETDSVVHYYEAGVFAAVLKNNGEQDTSLEVGEAGSVKISVNGHSITLLSVIDADEDTED